MSDEQEKVKTYGSASPLRNDLRDFQKESYEILDEISGDSDNKEGYILLKDDKNYFVYVAKGNFKLRQ